MPMFWHGLATKGIVATPHSQRSYAQLHLQLDNFIDELPLTAIIDDAEAALGTAVQTAVKRPDEQAFALANGQNLMFCEDAARRLNLALQRTPGINQFHIRVIHAESLHAHDAVAESSWRREQKMIRCQSLVWGAPGQPLTTPLSLEFESASLTAIIGANGCGKSSLLKVIAGLQKPLAGKGGNGCSTPKRHFSFLPQQQRLDPAVSISLEELIAAGFWGRRLSRHSCARSD